MSSDSCVAILCSKVYPEATEYQEFRVIWAHAIQNVNNSDQQMHSYFKEALVFDEWKDAILCAKDYEEFLGPSEHGILIIKHKHDATWDEIAAGRRYTRKKRIIGRRGKRT